MKLLTLLLLINSLGSYLSLAQADVVLDGTLGNDSKLAGPDFQIGADLGRQEGNNLFHSFSEFDLNKEQTAIFQGPGNIEHIIGRVTSNKFSQIDGTIRTEIPNASLYLINPEGFWFGPNARLDLAGSLYVSTANQLHLGNGGVFNARPQPPSVLVSAPPSAFGFLDTAPAKITLNQGSLATGPGKTLALLGGEIRITEGVLRAISGQINLIAISSNNWLTLAPDNKLQTEPNTKFGKIVIENQTNIDVGKEGAGNIYIRGGQLTLSRSNITANTAVDKKGGMIKLEADELRLEQEANIDSRTFGPGQGGQIIIKVAGLATLSNNSTIQSSTLSTDLQAGGAGNIVLDTRCLVLEGSTISTATEGPGTGGDIVISAFDYITLTTTDLSAAAIRASSIPKEGKENTAGDAGRIHLTARDLQLSGNLSKIDNSTAGAGLGGNITLKVANSLRLTGEAAISADSKGTGEAGNISIQTNQIDLADHSTISTATDKADGGNIIIKTPHSLSLSNSQISATVSGGRGQGGNLLISNPRWFRLTNSAVIANATRGKGGLVLIVTGTPIKSENSFITASSEQGVDGDVKIDDIYNVDLSALPMVFLDASGLIKKRCVAKTDADLSQFLIVGKRGLSATPDDLQSYTPTP